MQNVYAMPDQIQAIEYLVYQGQQLRIIRADSGVHWVVRDIAKALGFKEPHNASRKIPTRTFTLPTNGGKQPVSTVDIDGLNAILLRSRRPGLKEFREWVSFEAMAIINGRGDN